jgi:divalent metal cation (Fe/Co/Zn/Cd) transporter
LGHRLHADIVIAIDANLPLAEANGIAATLRRQLSQHMPELRTVNITFAAQANADVSAARRAPSSHHLPPSHSRAAALQRNLRRPA